MNRIDISPIVRGSITEIDLLKHKGKFQLNSTSNTLNNTGSIFIIEGDRYHFQLSVDQNGVYVQRNNEECILKASELSSSPLYFFILTWSSNRLRLITQTQTTGLIEKVKMTTPCIAPISLKQWAKKRLFTPQEQFETIEDFRESVYSGIASMKEKIENNGATEIFWDFSYSGNKIINKTPKKESLIQPLIKTLMHDEFLMKNIDVYRENQTSRGNVDFTMVGSVKENGLSNICIEVKNAHSKDLENGLLSQLPKYMASQNACFGAYIVLNYDKQAQDKLSIFEKLSLLQLQSPDPLVRGAIRAFIIKVDKLKSASIPEE